MRKYILQCRNSISDAQLVFLAKLAFAIAWIVILFRFVTIGTNLENYGIIIKATGFIPAMLACYELMRRAVQSNDKIGAYVNGFGALVNLVAMFGVAANLIISTVAQAIAPHVESFGPIGFLVIITSLLILNAQRYFSYRPVKHDPLDKIQKQRLGRDVFWLCLTEIGLIIPYTLNNKIVVTACIALAVFSNISDTIDTGIIRMMANNSLAKKIKRDVSSEEALQKCEEIY